MTISQPTIPGVVLAAGRSKRYGDQNKLLLQLGSSAVIKHSLTAMLNSAADPVFLVTGYQSEQITHAIGDLSDHPKLALLHNLDWESGRASSLRLALQSIRQKNYAGAIITLGDMPLMRTELIDRLISSFQAKNRLTFAVVDGEKGHPIIWPREFWQELTEIEGDLTAFDLVKQLWDETERVKLSPEEALTQLDMDTPEHFERIREAWSERS